jgi:hypothetical protein
MQSSTSSYKVTHFRDICAAYPTWDALRTYLESEVGMIVCSEDKERHLCIIRYDKTKPVKEENRWWRSVVWDTVSNRPLCIAPPKTSSTPMPDASGLVEEEYLDGFMINAWTDKSDGIPKIATRSSIGAAGTFHSRRSFAELFADAVGDMQLKDMVGDGFASFHCQHAANRFVTPVESPRAWRIHHGSVDADGTVTIVEDPIAAPAVADRNSWKVQGIIYKDGAGGRWRVRNSAYQMVRSLRGNQSRIDVRFAQLRQQKMIDTYVFYYPEEADEFRKLESTVGLVIENIYDAYVGVHIRHDKKLGDIESMYRPHVYSLHTHYLSVLKPNGYFIRRKEVAEYVNGLPWQRLVFLMTRA